VTTNQRRHDTAYLNKRLFYYSKVVVSTDCDRRNLLITIIVHCVDNTCGMTQIWNRTRASILSQW